MEIILLVIVGFAFLVAIEYLKQSRNEQLEAERRKSLCGEFQKTYNNLSMVDINIDHDATKKRLNYGHYSVNTTMLRKNTKISNVNRYVAIDVETTGLSPVDSEIISIAVVKFEDLEPIEAMYTLVKPLKDIDPRASEVNGITLEDVADKPVFAEVREAFAEFIGDYNIVAHNIMFDLKFLRHQGIDLETHNRKYYDTLELSRTFDKNSVNHKLTTACQDNDIFLGNNSHDACADALACGLLFAKYVSQKVNGYK